MKIPKIYSGHAAAILRELLADYKPPTRVQTMSKLYDPADDGPEVDIIQFFKHHKHGLAGGIPRYLHI